MIKKKINNKEYYYLRESRRENGKVIAKTIAYLGKNEVEAKKKMKEFLGGSNKSDSKSDSKIKKQKSLNNEMETITIEDIANFCKKKGFVFRSSDIYGGFAGFWDFGPLGVELFNNIKQNWWDYFVHQKENIVGIEASIISHPKTWKASGHIENFSDVAVICKKCKKATKLDKSEVRKVLCECGGEFESRGDFNLMFKTSVGAINPDEAYLRGETAQGMFLDFKLVQATSRKRLPFGIAQIGRCFRNEIAPRDFLFRSREFHIGEFEFFIHPEEKKCPLLDRRHLNLKFMFLDEENQKNGKEKLREVTIKQILDEKKLGEWHAYWLAEQIFWFLSIGLNKIKVREHTKDELSHYSSATFDIDYEFPFGSKEIAGNANRGQYDLTQHAKESGQNMEIFDENTGQKVLPKVIEPTFGMERVFLSVLANSYGYDSKRENIVLKLPKNLAPIKAAVFPLVKADKKLVKFARKIYEDLKKEWNIVYDESGSVGRRYARNDEIGTPFCITIDGESLDKKDVTIRDRDTTKQIRVKTNRLKEILKKLIYGEMRFEKAGKLIK